MDNRQLEIDVQAMLDAKVPEARIAEYIRSVMPKQGPGVDTDTGGGFVARLNASGLAPDDRLATARQFYPDAQPLGDNIVFTHPKTGRVTLFDEQGLGLGDLADMGRPVAQTVGSALVGTAGNLASGGPLSPASPAGTYLGMGAGVAAGGTAYDSLLELFGKRQDSRGVPQRAFEAVTDAATEAALGKAGDVALNAVKPLASPIKTMLKKTIDDPQQTAIAVRQMLDDGLRPDIGFATGTEGSRQLAAAQRKNPGGADPLAKLDWHNYNRLKSMRDDIAAALAGTRMDIDNRSLEGLRGETSRRLAQSVARNVEAKDAALKAEYEALDSLYFQPGEKIPTPNTQRILNEIGGGDKYDRAFVRDIAKLRDALEESTPNVVDLATGLRLPPKRDMRTFREQSSKAGQIFEKDPSISTRDAERFYWATRDDLGDARLAKGNVAASQYADLDARYSEFMGDSRKGIQGDKQTMEKLGRKDSGYDLYNHMKSLLQAGKADEFTRVLRYADADEAAAIKANLFLELGQPSPGSNLSQTGDGFSFNRFITNANKMFRDEATKRAFFGSAAPAYDKLFKYSAMFKDLEKYRNFSNTAPTTMWNNLVNGVSKYAAIGAMTGGAIGGHVNPVGMAKGAVAGAAMPTLWTAGQLTTSRAVSDALTNQKTIKWLADGAEIALFKPNNMPNHLARLLLRANAGDIPQEFAVEMLRSFGVPFTARKKSGETETTLELQEQNELQRRTGTGR